MTKPRRTMQPPSVPTPAEGKPDYVPRPAEAEAIGAHLNRRDRRPPAPRVRVSHRPSGPVQMEPDHPQPVVYSVLFQDAFGTTEPVFAERLLNQAMNAAHGGRGEPVAQDTVNAVLAAMHGLAPRDEVEALLGVQMLATHEAAVEFLRRARQTEYRQSLQDSGNLAVKLLRTFTMQLEALQKYRGGGQQRIVVERVTVNRDGQAIVGHVEAGTGRGVGASSESEKRAHAQERRRAGDAPEPEVRGADAEREPVPVAGGAG